VRPALRSRAIAALAVLFAACDGAYLTAPPESTITLTANPPFVAAHGGVSVITAFVVEPAGTYVPDGTVVRWFTDLGRIDPETRTRNGVAQAHFVSDARSGEATITAMSGAVTATLAQPLVVGNTRVAAIRLRAVPSRIIESNSTHVIATVVDDAGNPVPNVDVFFRVVDDPATEFFDSAGAPRPTNNNGEAEDVLRTRRDFVGVAEVQAIVAGPSGLITSERLRIPIL
jgi:hypothetical protein